VLLVFDELSIQPGQQGHVVERGRSVLEAISHAPFLLRYRVVYLWE